MGQRLALCSLSSPKLKCSDLRDQFRSFCPQELFVFSQPGVIYEESRQSVDPSFYEMHSNDGSLSSSRHFHRWSFNHAIITTFLAMHSYLYLFDSIFALGLFTSTVAALFSHKIMVILLHQPLSAAGIILTAPCLFVFDVVTLLLLYRGIVSRFTILRVLSYLVSMLVIICSAAFASMYIQGNVELSWTRSVEVFIRQIFLANPSRFSFIGNSSKT